MLSLLVLSIAVVFFLYRRWKQKQTKIKLAKIKKLGGKAGMDITKNLDTFLAKRIDNAKSPCKYMSYMCIYMYSAYNSNR